ncbi:MAG: hypothetical protein ABJB66_11250, partial [Gemmatimonadaceae bacterium]
AVSRKRGVAEVDGEVSVGELLTARRGSGGSGGSRGLTATATKKRGSDGSRGFVRNGNAAPPLQARPHFFV